MRTCAPPAIANVAQNIATVNDLPRSYAEAGKMAVECGNSLAVIDNNGASIAIHEAGKTNDAICGGDDASTDLAGNIDAAMKCAFTVEWVSAFSKAAGNATLHRPQRWRSGHAHPVPGRGVRQVHADPNGGRAAHCCALESIKLFNGCG